MNIKNYVYHIFYIFLCCLILNNYYVTALEVGEEAAAQREVRESIERAKSKQVEANDRIEQAKKEQAEATGQEKTEAELREQDARSDFYSAQIDEQKGLLDLANQKNNEQDAKQAQQAIKDAENKQAEVQAKITELTKQLTQEFVQAPNIRAIVLESQLVDYAQNLQVGTFDSDLSQKSTYLADLRMKAQNMFLNRTIEDGLATEKTTGEKLRFLDDKRMTLNGLLDVYRDEFNKLDEWLKSNKITEAAQQYKESLEQAMNSISQKKVMLDMYSASLELQNVSLFSKIVSSVKNWFDSTFDFHKTPWYKRSVDYEISKLDDIKQQIDQLKQEKNIENFASRVTDMSVGIKDLETQFQNYKDGKVSLNVDEFTKNIEEWENNLKNLSDSDIQNVRNAVDAFNTLYKDSLQPMTGDISAKMARYKNPQSLTLFDQLADYYASNSIFGGLSYRPEQAYQALFTPEIIANLNAKNPDLHLTSAMFDPLKFDPDTISPDLIDLAYAESELVYKVGTSAWKAARNAGFILRNPVDKATYDSFLKDYKNLLSKGIKDPYKGRSPLDTMTLNNEGALSKIQITEATINQLKSIDSDIATTIQEKSAFDDAERALSTLDTIKQKVQTLKQNVSDFRSGQQFLGDN